MAASIRAKKYQDKAQEIAKANSLRSWGSELHQKLIARALCDEGIIEESKREAALSLLADLQAGNAHAFSIASGIYKKGEKTGGIEI